MMFRVLALGLVIYVVWKVAEGFFGGKAERKPRKPVNPYEDKDGFAEYEEVE